jgi:hypothetical protein
MSESNMHLWSMAVMTSDHIWLSPKSSHHFSYIANSSGNQIPVTLTFKNNIIQDLLVADPAILEITANHLRPLILIHLYMRVKWIFPDFCIHTN